MRYMFYSKEEKALQKKLIPLNIVIAILALVAAISLLITPLLTINVGKALKSARELMGNGDSAAIAVVTDVDSGSDGSGSENGGSDNGSGSGSDEGGSGGSDEGGSSGSDMDAMFDVIADVLDSEIVIKPLGMAKIAFAPADKKTELFLNDFFVDNGFIEKLMVSFIDISLASALDGITEANLPNINFVKLNEVLMDLDNADTVDSFKTKTNAYILELANQVKRTLTAEEQDAINEQLEKMYNDAQEVEGKFSVEKMICVMMSPEDTTYTNYVDLLGAMSADGFEGGEGMAASIAPIVQMLGSVAPYYGYGFYYVAAHALIWIILFLFAFIRVFKRNKRFTMWYVKLVSCWPCIIFGVILSFAGAQIAAKIPELVALAGIFGAFSTMTWISGACYLLLWLFSICWAFPIKRKIRKMRKNMK